ncbi:DUF262 domain-containing protein [Fulvimarina sp. MAC8]|uniref:GmrSD restriction endonuclease domain-containing protein n=1 Tax=Fulvimarina sp. MAC8 TaxID=3162874 RepID=UPI0032EE7D58
MEARNRTIEEWFSWIRDGNVVLPRFQRFEAWGYSQVEGILENIIRKPSLPVGALLTLEVGDTPPFLARPISGAPEPKETPRYHLLDGQQRLTALWRSLTGGYTDVTFFVDASDGPEPKITAVRRYEKNGKLYPQWCEDASEVWKKKLLPVSLLAPDERTRQDLSAWTGNAAAGDFDIALRITEIAGELRKRIAAFSIPFLSLPAGTDRDAALDVFIKMNTQNTALSAFDIVVAQVESAIDESLHEKVEGLRAAVPQVASFGDPGEIAMQVGAVLSGKAPTRASFLSADFGRSLIERWDLVEKGLERAIGFLMEEKIFNGATLPGDPLLTLLAAYWATAPEGGDKEGQARRLARRMLWIGAFSSRYDKTSATRTELDYRELTMFRDTGSGHPVLLDNRDNPLPDVETLRTGGWPKTKDKLGRAILAASLRVGGLDFADGAPVAPSNLARREYHHLFPKALVDGQYPKRVVFSALNCALISWRTNRNIAARPPSVYIADRADEIAIDRTEVDRRLMSHAIPVDALRTDKFDVFLDERAKLVHHIMMRLCAGYDVHVGDVETFLSERQDNAMPAEA